MYSIRCVCAYVHCLNNYESNVYLAVCIANSVLFAFKMLFLELDCYYYLCNWLIVTYAATSALILQNIALL